MHLPPVLSRSVGVLILASLLGVVSSCGSTSGAPSATEAVGSSGTSVVSVDTAVATLENAPADLVILDVRTPEEYETARLDGALIIDFYETDFADRIAELDRDVPYLLYCRSGNRSGQTRQIMEDLGFTEVYDVDGGINAWQAAGHNVISG